MRGIHTVCPEAPSTINVTQNIVEMDGENSFFVDERFTGADVVSGVLTLSHTPYAAASVQVSLNSGVQRPTSDFIIVGNTVRFIFVPAAADAIHVRYFALESGSTTVPGGTSLPTGFTLGYNGSTEPEGWLFMRPATTVTAALDALFAFLTVNPHLINETPGAGVESYTLREIMTPYFDVSTGTMVQGATIIKT